MQHRVAELIERLRLGSWEMEEPLYEYPESVSHPRPVLARKEFGEQINAGEDAHRARPLNLAGSPVVQPSFGPQTAIDVPPEQEEDAVLPWRRAVHPRVFEEQGFQLREHVAPSCGRTIQLTGRARRGTVTEQRRCSGPVQRPVRLALCPTELAVERLMPDSMVVRQQLLSGFRAKRADALVRTVVAVPHGSARHSIQPLGAPHEQRQVPPLIPRPV